MNAISQYDDFIKSLLEKIDNEPTKKYRIILGEIRKTDCPYLKSKIKNLL